MRRCGRVDRDAPSWLSSCGSSTPRESPFVVPLPKHRVGADECLGWLVEQCGRVRPQGCDSRADQAVTQAVPEPPREVARTEEPPPVVGRILIERLHGRGDMFIEVVAFRVERHAPSALGFEGLRQTLRDQPLSQAAAAPGSAPTHSVVNLVNQRGVHVRAVNGMVGVDGEDYRMWPVGRAAESPLRYAVARRIDHVDLNIAGTEPVSARLRSLAEGLLDDRQHALDARSMTGDEFTTQTHAHIVAAVLPSFRTLRQLPATSPHEPIGIRAPGPVNVGPGSLRWHILPTEVVVVATRNVVLSQHQHQLVESLVASGRYQNASEVLREGLRLLEHQEAEDAAKIAALREAADRGWADLASRRYEDLADDDLDDFVGQLGVRAAAHARSAG